MILVWAKLICLSPRTFNSDLLSIIFIYLTFKNILVLMLGIFDEKDYRRLSLLQISNCSNGTLLARMPEKRAQVEFPLGFGCSKTKN